LYDLEHKIDPVLLRRQLGVILEEMIHNLTGIAPGLQTLLALLEQEGDHHSYIFYILIRQVQEQAVVDIELVSNQFLEFL
jgi:hypothetical protein